MAKQTNQTVPASGALQRLVDREEILQICYWYQGEGLGEVYNSKVLQPFLNYEAEQIDIAFNDLTNDGYFEIVSIPTQGYRLTESGKKQGGRLFTDSFADFQKAGHGECAAGCCENGDHSQCGDDCLLH